MHLEAIDVDLWYVVKNGIPKTGEGVTVGVKTGGSRVGGPELCV